MALALALVAALAVAHAKSRAWQLLAHTPFMREPRTPLMRQAWALVEALAHVVVLVGRACDTERYRVISNLVDMT